MTTQEVAPGQSDAGDLKTQSGEPAPPPAPTPAEGPGTATAVQSVTDGPINALERDLTPPAPDPTPPPATAPVHDTPKEAADTLMATGFWRGNSQLRPRTAISVHRLPAAMAMPGHVLLKTGQVHIPGLIVPDSRLSDFIVELALK